MVLDGGAIVFAAKPEIDAEMEPGMLKDELLLRPVWAYSRVEKCGIVVKKLRVQVNWSRPF